MPIPVAVRNFPVPEPHLGLLGLGVALHVLRPLHLPTGPATTLVGGALVGGGAAIAFAATLAAEQTDLADPSGLVTRGPFAVSRNPMYEAWTSIYCGAGLTIGSAWPLILLPSLLALVHAAVGQEERELGRRFGAAYEAYAQRVPRYAWQHAFQRVRDARRTP
jgi:protein-S-isoprenylcysteine O-methyltransferase Ste14